MTRHRSLIVAVGFAAAMIVATAIVQGRWTERWYPHTSQELLNFADAMNTIPVSIGEWDGESRPPTSQRELDAAGAVGHLTRNYRNPKSGRSVLVYMICGASRDIAVHTPDACYPGAGFRLEGSTTKLVLPAETASKAEFMTAAFFKEAPEGTQRLRVFWAWNAYGNWEAPDWPRVRYGGRTALAKLYLICPEPNAEPPEKSPALEFCREFLPIVDRQLFPPPQTSPAAMSSLPP